MSAGWAGWSRGQRVALLAIVLAGVGGRSAWVGRPLDHRLLAPWREADYVQIARNFYRDGLDILHPQIDWRGNTPGYAEMELPVVPWVGAGAYHVLGYHEALLRVPAAILGVLLLLLFVRFCRLMLPPPAALFAAAAFALNPLALGLGNAIQPDPVMLFLSLLAMGVIWRWEDAPRAGTLLLAAGLTALAILAKAPAAFLGIVLAAAVWRRWGAASLRRPEVWAAAVLALAPPLGWYVWAYRFWKVYGLSLGLSNETHLIGLDMLRPPRFLVGIAKWETLGVFTPAGWLLVAAALAWPGAWRRRLLVWYGAVLLFYVVSARTSGDDWSFYYHALSIAPGCLLMGAGLAALLEGRGIGPPAWQRGVAVLAAIGTLAGLAAAGAYLIHRRDSNADYLAMRTCDLEFARQVPPTGLIVVDGGTMFDEYGTPVAHNESMAFAWMDRKGFNYGTEELAVDTLDAIAARGGQYWIARDRELGRQDLRQQVDARYQRLARCGTFTLYDLQTRPDRAAE